MPSQARLADLLATGCSLKEAAKQLDITPVSARQYLKLIFQKTGTHRQAELVRKILLVPAPRRGAALHARTLG
jgi:DNA-binding CsgD family transcriptional regulator